MARPTMGGKLLSSTMAAALLMSSLAGCNRPQDTSSLLADARQYRQKGETKAAIIQLKNVVQKEPNNAQVRVLLAELYIDSGDAVSADKELQKAQALGTKAQDILPQLGKVMLMQGQFEKLLGEIKAPAAGPNQVEIAILRANASLGLGKTDQARELFEFVLGKSPDQAAALLGLARISLASQQFASATKLIEQALAKHPADIDVLRLKGDVLRAQGKDDAARMAYGQILALRPDNAQAHIDIANLYIQSGKFSEAAAAIAAARKAAPTALIVLYTQALLDFREKKFKSSLDALQQVLRVLPDNMPSVLLMGSVQLALGSDQQAGLYLQKFLDANPRHIFASKLLATIALKNGKPDVALGLLLPVLQVDKNNVELLALAGEAQMRTRHFSQAAEFFQKASDLTPQAAGLHTALGVSKMGMGESARAIAELERAAALDVKGTQAGVMLVMTHLRNKDYDKALTAVTAMERQQEKNPMVHNLKGGVFLAKQDFVAARASFQKALAIDPVYLPALENLVQLDRLDKKPEQSRQRYEAALAGDKKNAGLMTALAKLAAVQGNVAETARWLERASNENPDALAPAMTLADFYHRSGQKEKALVLAQKLQVSNPANPDTLNLLAQIQYGTGNYDAALDSLARLATMQPTSAALQLRLAQVQVKLKDPASALESARKAMHLAPDSLEAQALTMALLMDKKSYPEALVIAQMAQKQHPDAPAGLVLEGDVWMAQGKPQDALKAYERAFGLSKTGPLLLKIHASQMSAGKTQEARLRITQWLQEHPADVNVRLYFAAEKLQAREYKPAIEQYELIIKQVPGHVIALNDLAWACQQEKDKRALDFAERAFKLAPDNPAILDTLGWILLEQGDAARAVSLLQKASSAAPNASDIRYHLGMGLIKTGDKRAARIQFEQLLASGDAFPKRDEVKALLTKL